MSWEIQQDQNNQLTCLQKKIFITRGTVLTVLLKTGTNILGKKLFKGRFCWAYICRAYSEALFSEGFCWGGGGGGLLLEGMLCYKSSNIDKR